MAPRNTRVAPEVQPRSAARSFAQTLDNFYTPASDARRERAFQGAVNDFSSIFEEQANIARTNRRKDEYQQGVADSLREQAGEELKGVKTGSIFRQNSQFYMAGLNETRGKAAASRFKSEMMEAYRNWEGRHTDDDGSAYREWMNGRVAEFMESLGDDQHKLAGALPIINEVTQNYAAQHTAYTSQRLEEESWEAYDDIVEGVLTGFADGSIDLETVGQRLAEETDGMYDVEGPEANNRMVAAVIRYANIHNDIDAIRALAKAHDNGQVKLSQVNREKLANAADAVEADLARDERNRSARETAEAKAASEAAIADWAEVLEQDPYADLPPTSSVDHKTWKSMKALQDAVQTAAANENPEIANGRRMLLEADLFDAGTRNEKIAVLRNFTTQNPHALSAADVARYTKEILDGTKAGSLVTNSTVAQFRRSFGRTVGALQAGDGFDVVKSSFMQDQAEIHFNTYMLAKGASVDANDPAALNAAIKEAQEYAWDRLAADFPELVREKAAESPLGDVSGANPAIERQDAAQEAARQEELRVQAEQAERAAQAAQQAAEADNARRLEEAGDIADRLGREARANAQATEVLNRLTAEAEEQLGVRVGEIPEEPELPLEEQPTPFEDANSDEEYPPIRAGFYGELLNRFTDGEDTRTLASATAVLQGDEEFSDSVIKLADKLSVDPMALMSIMDFETGGTFDPAQPNGAGSGATGLIQFMPKTARALGTTTAELARMSRSEQMVYVEKYFDQFPGIRGGTIEDLYMAVLWPKAIGKPRDYVLFRVGDNAYGPNSGLDRNEDGTVTKAEAARKVASKFYGY